MAIPTTPPWTFGGATTDPSGVEAETPTPSGTGTWTPRGETALPLRAGVAALPRRLILAIWPLIDERSCRREASCDSIRCFCAAFCATIVCCSEWAFRSSFAVTLDRSLEGRDLLDDARVLARGGVDCLDPVEQIVKARCAEAPRASSCPGWMCTR
jgi:hypothetical protein